MAGPHARGPFVSLVNFLRKGMTFLKKKRNLSTN